MPTVLRIGPYRFFFFSNENNEPPHVHVQRENMLAKVWLTSVSLASSVRFRPHELREILRHVGEHQETLLEAWNEYFRS